MEKEVITEAYVLDQISYLLQGGRVCAGLKVFSVESGRWDSNSFSVPFWQITQLLSALVSPSKGGSSHAQFRVEV